MKILVLGAGLIGMTTAYALGRQGHEVIVIDKEDKVASGTSHANAGQLSYSYVDPFPRPGILTKLPGYMLGRDNGIKINPTRNAHFYLWGLKFLGNCTHARAKSNMSTMLGFAHQSMEATQRLCAELPTNVSGDLLLDIPKGKIILARTQADIIELEERTFQKQQFGFDVEILNREDCISKEPALKTWQGDFCGGLFAKDESTLNPLKLCRALQGVSAKRFGVVYKMSHKIESLIVRDNKVTGVSTDHGSIDCDKVILCLGTGANELLKTMGKSCSIYPMRGYSLTLPAGPQAPKMSITDPVNKLVFANFGDQVRIAGFLDANLSEGKIKSRGKELLEIARKLWPEAADYSADDHLWAGYRPMTPSGVPIVKASVIEGLYYNMGHGSLGLTLAAGSAERIADLV
jgi:D-amino-acid dehydrogenase